MFHRKLKNFAISRNKCIDCILIKNFLILLTFLEFLKIVSIKKVTLLMISAKMAIADLLKRTVF